MSNRDDVDLNLLSSVTSTKIEKITITSSTASRLPAGHARWVRLDDILNRLVEGLERGLKLEVEFRKVRAPWVGRELDLGERLPMFVKRGRMTVFDKNGLIYCSDGVGERR